MDERLVISPHKGNKIGQDYQLVKKSITMSTISFNPATLTPLDIQRQKLNPSTETERQRFSNANSTYSTPSGMATPVPETDEEGEAQL